MHGIDLAPLKPEYLPGLKDLLLRKDWIFPPSVSKQDNFSLVIPTHPKGNRSEPFCCESVSGNKQSEIVRLI